MTLVEILRVARRCHGIITQNFWGTLLVDAAGVVLAAVGVLNPLLAAFVHMSSELAFILNSTRARRQAPFVTDFDGAVILELMTEKTRALLETRSH